MAKAGYNHERPSGLGKLFPEASGKERQKTLKAKGVEVPSSKAGIGYTPPTPIRIPIRKTSVLMISTDDKEEEQPSKPSKKLSVFDRIDRPTPHILVFDRLGTQEDDNFVMALEALFLQDSVIQLLPKMALEVLLLQDLVMQLLLNSQRMRS